MIRKASAGSDGMGLHDTSMTTADSNETDIDARDRRWMRRALELARLAESEDGAAPLGVAPASH